MPIADRLAVQPLAVAGRRLDRVAEGVAEVQQRALARARARRAATIRGLDLAGAADRMRQRLRHPARAARATLASSQSKNAGVARCSPYLMTSASPARSSRGGSVPSVSVSAITAARLVERADQVLAARVIDAGLAADRGIDLREQRRRHLHEVDAALVAGGREPGHVADHAAAERDHAGVAVQPSARPARRRRGRGTRASCAARRRAATHRRRAGPARPRSRRSRYSGPTVSLVTTSTSRAGDPARRATRRVVNQPRTDQDRVARVPEVHVDAFARRCIIELRAGAWLKLAEISSTTISTLRRPCRRP